MSSNAWMSLSPMLILSGGVLILMMQIAFARKLNISLIIALLSMAATCVALLLTWPTEAIDVTPLLVADRFGYLFAVLFTLGGLCIAVMSARYLAASTVQAEEYLLLLLLAVFGALVLSFSRHLASMLLGIEVLGISMYTLIAYPAKQWQALEAGIKYLVLSGAGTATILFGFALLYAELGALSFTGIGDALASEPGGPVVMASAVMILGGLGFKLSLVPYHMWTPDVYEGAWTPVGGFLTTISKAALFVTLLRWFLDAELYRLPVLLDSLALLSILSMLIGNVLALRQRTIKRLLAYSSIAHMGYLIVAPIVYGFLADTRLATEAAGYYVIAYTVSTLAAFAALSQLPSLAEDNPTIEDLTGLFWRAPRTALLLAVSLLSLAGIPLTVGFLGKFYLIAAGVSAQLWPLITVLLIGSAIGIYYYLRIIYTMAQAVVEGDDESPVRSVQLPGVTLMLITAVVFLGVYPQPLISYLASAF